MVKTKEGDWCVICTVCGVLHRNISVTHAIFHAQRHKKNSGSDESVFVGMEVADEGELF